MLVTQKNWTVKEILERCPRVLEEVGVSNARLEIEMLLSSVLGFCRSELYLNFDLSLDLQECCTLKEALNSRRKRIPLQYIMGKQGFRQLQLIIEEGVFIPRPETEVVVEEALGLIKDIPKHLIAADVGTGSGAIALSLAQELDDIYIYALDSSPSALAVARQNAFIAGLENKVAFRQSNLLDALPSKIISRVDLIVSNPPYIPSGEIDSLPSEISFEPREALDGGDDGLNFYYLLIKQSLLFLKDSGKLVVEIGHSAEKVACMFEENAFEDVRILKDLNHQERVVLGYKKP